MRRLRAKLAFLHRLFWMRDPYYRAAVVLGPPPLLGVAIGAAIWFAVQQWPHTAAAPAGSVPWAQRPPTVAAEEQPFVELPSLKLPPAGPAGDFIGYQTGWHGAIQPMIIDATMDVDVTGSPLAGFSIEQPAIPLSRILEAGPSSGLYVGAALTFLAIRTPGLYAVSLHFQRSAPQSVDCLFRLGSAKHRLIRNVTLNVNGTSSMTFPATELMLQPGLYPLGIAVGCWRGGQSAGPGELTLMIRSPGETELRPARNDEVLTPRAKPG